MRCGVLLVSLALVAAGAFGGCALVGDPCGAPVTGTATFVSASVPPPYHQEWTLRLADDAGSITYSPGYGSTERWTATFTPDPDQVVRVCRDLQDERDAGTAPGGGTLEVRWQGATGRPTRLTTSDADAGTRVLAVVPTPALVEVQSAFARWALAHGG